jgi:hypothetical protein
MKLFISQAKDSARDIALALHSWLPKTTMNVVNTWCAADPKCLQQGSGYPDAILQASRDCDACLAVLTRESIVAWWLNFETGLFFGQNKKVYALLCGDVTHQMLGAHGHPLSANGVNYTSLTEESLASFLASLKSGDIDWLKNDFKEQVSYRFKEIKSVYDGIFDEDNIRLNSLLANSAEDTEGE